MYFRKVFILVLLMVITFGPAASRVEANFSSGLENQNKIQLLLQIQKLLAEVLRLQAILEERALKKAPVDSSYIPYKLTLFQIKTSAIYLVEEGELFSIGRPSGIDTTDEKLFDLFTTIVGKDEMKTRVKEWRTYKNNDTNIDAFVELIAGTDSWVIGVNKEDFRSGDVNNEKSFADLFIHEFAHIILFEKLNFEKSFREKFWTAKDLNHQDLLKSLSESARFSRLEEYYDSNSSRFVSEYATMNSDEDMAETFLDFVKSAKPEGENLKEQKVLFFYQDNDFVKLRLKIRSNLNGLGML